MYVYSTDKGAVFSLSACAGSLEALISVVSKFVEFMKVGSDIIPVCVVWG